jgi:hypothetical protein
VVRFLPVLKDWPDPVYFYALPTFNQARRVAWRPILKLVPPDWIKGEPNETELRIDTIFGSTLYVIGMDKPSRLEGSQYDGCVVDESCDQKPGSFARSILPALSHRNGWCWRIGVPKRVGPGAAEFKDFCKSGAAPGTIDPSTGRPAEHETYSWPSEDILTEEQLHWARENLDPKDYNEQYRAAWETIGGVVFHCFDEVLDVSSSVAYDPAKTLIIGSDFNVDPMAWIIAQRSDDKQQLEVIDELWVRNTNTQECLTRLHERFRSHTAGFAFFGDATGRSRNTRASESDYLQIRNDKRFNGATVHYPRSNPSRANRFASCNALFANAEGQRRCKIHPRCINLIRDLTHRAYKEGTTDVDDYGDVGHITDAFGYVVHRLFPMSLHIAQQPEVATYGSV